MFFRFIALLFLIIFLIKLLNPNTIPYFKNILQFIQTFFYTVISYFFKNIAMGGYLLFKQTVYVVGSALGASIFLTVVVFLISYYPDYTFSLFWTTLKQDWFNLYVLSFFLTTFILGLIEILKENGSFSKERIKGYFKGFTYTIHGDKGDEEKKENDRVQTKGHYVYDEETKQYRYEEDK